jgi:hypothetical protein
LQVRVEIEPREDIKVINKLLKLGYVIVVVGLLLAQYSSAMPTDDVTAVSRSEYFVPAPLEPQLSSDGNTLYNGVPPIVYVADPNPSPKPVRIPAPFDLLTLPPQSATATFSITYVPNGSTDAWGEPCYTFPEAAKTAFNAATSIWGNIIQSSVPITIRACWASLTGGTLGYSGGGPIIRDFPGAPFANTWYVKSLANALAGTEQVPGYFDMHITYNLNFSWYYGTDGTTPAGQYDLMSVVLHEVTHGLGFAGSMNYSGGLGAWGSSGYPIIYDTFMRDGSGNQLINTSVYPNPSTGLGTALTSDNIYFHGSNAMAANGGVRVKMYAPATWADGSSYSHLDYLTFLGTANKLMVYAISSGSSIHDPGPVTKGLLNDLGWTIPSDTTRPETTITGGPSGTITTRNVTFTYTGTDNVTPSGSLVYATYLQGYDSGWSSFNSSTTKSYTNLPNGTYTFQVKAKDQAGNEDLTPATRSFIVAYLNSCDFNGDGKPDILWRNTHTGQNYVWYMNGVTNIGGAYIDTEPYMEWEIAGVADFNNDGNPDILWRNTHTGQNYVWYMNGVTNIGGAYIDTEPYMEWKIVGP